MTLVLDNIKRTVQLDAVERQELANQVSAQYGSLAFMYAKSVHRKERTLESVNERFYEPIQDILNYVTKNGYELILE